MSFIENSLAVILLLVFCIVVSYWENKKHNTFITPFGALAWPYTIVVAMINLGGVYFGFFPVSFTNIIYVIFCLLFFLLGGQFISVFLNNDILRKEYKYKQRLIEIIGKSQPVIYIISILTIIAGMYNFYNAIQETGWLGIASVEFEEAYGKGLLSHFILLNRPIFFILFAKYLIKKTKIDLIFLLLIFIQVVVLQIKYHIVILLLGAIFSSYFLGILKFNIKKILFGTVIIYFLFNLTYVIGFSRIGLGHAYSSKVQAFLFNHFFTYLFGGPIGFSELFKNVNCPIYSIKEIFAVPINLLTALSGNKDLVNVIIHQWIPVSYNIRYFHSSNVFGLFGFLYYFTGTYVTLIVCFFLGSILYLIRLLMLKFKYQIGFIFLYSYQISLLCISFFGYYYCILDVNELAVYFLVLPYVWYKIPKELKLL